MWVKLLIAKYRSKEDSLQKGFESKNGSRLWNSVTKIWHMILSGMIKVVGNGRETKFWEDRWTELENNVGEHVGPRIPKGEKAKWVADYVDPMDCWESEKINQSFRRHSIPMWLMWCASHLRILKTG